MSGTARAGLARTLSRRSHVGPYPGSSGRRELLSSSFANHKPRLTGSDAQRPRSVTHTLSHLGVSVLPAGSFGAPEESKGSLRRPRPLKTDFQENSLFRFLCRPSTVREMKVHTLDLSASFFYSSQQFLRCRFFYYPCCTGEEIGLRVK